MDKIEFARGSAKFLMGIDNPAQLQKWFADHPTAVGFAMVGRSNVGKSSLINTLLGAKTAKTSKTPGRTREINIFSFKLTNLAENIDNHFYLFDLPGYGHAEISKEMAKNWELLMDSFFTYASSSTMIVNIQDARHPNQKADQAFQDYIQQKDPLSVMLVFNKLDKLKKQKERAALNKLKPEIFKQYKYVKLIHFLSAESKAGVEPFSDSVINFLLDYKNKLGFDGRIN